FGVCSRFPPAIKFQRQLSSLINARLRPLPKRPIVSSGTVAPEPLLPADKSVSPLALRTWFKAVSGGILAHASSLPFGSDSKRVIGWALPDGVRTGRTAPW